MRRKIMIGGELRTVVVDEGLTRNEKNQGWLAVLDNYEEGHPMGWGFTAEDAIEELKAEIAWRNETA